MVDVKATIHCPIADTRKWIARDWDARTSYTVTNEWMNVQVRRIAIGCGLIFETDLLDWHIHHIKLNLVVQMYHRANIERPRLERKRDRSTSTSYLFRIILEIGICRKFSRSCRYRNPQYTVHYYYVNLDDNNQLTRSLCFSFSHSCSNFQRKKQPTNQQMNFNI